MDKAKFLAYKDLNEKIKEFEAEKKALGLELTNIMKDGKIRKAQADYGTFSLVERTTYSYSKETDSKVGAIMVEIKEKTDPIIEPLEEQITKLQEEDKAEKKGEEETSTSFRFQAKKKSDKPEDVEEVAGEVII